MVIYMYLNCRFHLAVIWCYPLAVKWLKNSTTVLPSLNIFNTTRLVWCIQHCTICIPFGVNNMNTLLLWQLSHCIKTKFLTEWNDPSRIVNLKNRNLSWKLHAITHMINQYNRATVQKSQDNTNYFVVLA